MDDSLDGHQRDDDLTRALTAPGTPDELADSERYLAMFRAEHGRGAVPLRRRSHAVRRFGAGTALAGVLAVAGGGVAAAYTGSLPAPLQRTAHQVFGTVGVPQAEPAQDEPVEARRSPRPSRSASPSPSAAPSASTSSQPAPSRSAGPSPRRTPKPGVSRTPSIEPSASTTLLPSASASPVLPEPSPSATPSETASPSDGATATPTPTAPSSSTPAVPVTVRAISISAAGHQVAVDTSIGFTGSVTGVRGAAVSGRIVLLEQKTANGWRRLVSEETGKDGMVTLDTAPLQQSGTFRLTVGDVHSAPWRVVVTPVISATATVVPGPRGRTTAIVDVVVDGAATGEQVRVVRTGPRGERTIGRGRLGPDGTVGILVPVTDDPASYAVLLPANRQHAAARVTLVLPAPADQPGRG